MTVARLELARAMGRQWSLRWPKLKRNEELKDTGHALNLEEEARSPVLTTFIKALLLTAVRCGN